MKKKSVKTHKNNTKAQDNVAQRKRLEEELRESEGKYRELIKYAPAGIYEVDYETNLIINVNDAICEYTGYTRDELLTMSFFNLFTEESQKLMLARLEKLMAGEIIPQTVEYCIRTKAREELWILLNARYIYESGKLKGATGVIYNITERKRAEEVLREAARDWQTTFDATSDAICLLDTDQRILRCNLAMAKMFGVTQKKHIGRHCWDVVHGLTESIPECPIKRMQRSLVREEMEMQRGDRWFNVTTDPILDETRAIRGVVHIIRDITERKRAEESLKRAELEFRTIFDSASDGILLLNVGDGKFSYANKKICNMLGYTKKELLNLGIPDIHPQDSVPFVIDQCEKQFKKEILTAKNIPVVKKDKTVFFADISSSPITLSEKEYLLGMFRDITERKRMEDVLKESEKKYRDLSMIDDLTQLYNSRYFYAQLEIEIERSNRYGQPLTLLLLDLDKFKKFNDKYGHVEGDYVLLRLGQVVKRCLRETDSAYRYGGEEFTIILPMTTSNEGIVTAKRIQTELRKEVFYPVLGQEVNITVSIGLAEYKPKEEMKTFVQRVDKLMYQAKKDGRNGICPDRIEHKKSIIGSI
jgi:diguanylate cyclase (GGDEF)-like protein/PAS domain S-box-containing protein